MFSCVKASTSIQEMRLDVRWTKMEVKEEKDVIRNR